MYTDTFIKLKDECDNIIKKGWIRCENFNSGNVGLLFEKLLGLQNHNFSIPDYEGIEIKTKILNSIPKMTLFNATPDGYLYSNKALYEQYGYPSNNNKGYNSFNFTFSSKKRTYVNKKTYAKLFVDRSSKKIILNFYDNNFNIVNNDTSWSFDLLKQKMEIKLTYLLIMYAKRRTINGVPCCKYLYYNFYRYRGFEFFLKAIENDYIKITFSINTFKSGPRTGKIHDHGTSFDINPEYITELFESISTHSIYDKI